jgi:hypothetical protein
MSKRQHFQRFGRGVFKCSVCERSTRQVDQGGDSELCPQCWDLSGIDNSVNDKAQTLSEVAVERDYLLAEAVEKGGNAEHIKSSFTYLWTTQ